MKYLVQDPEVSVRCIYAQCIVQLADTAVRYLEMGQALKAHGTFQISTADAQVHDQAHFEVRTSHLLHSFGSHMFLTCRSRTTRVCKTFKLAFKNTFQRSSWTRQVS